MAFNIIFSPQVFEDIKQAVDWYDTKQKGLGNKFLSSVKHNNSILRKDPFCVAVKYDEIRCIPVYKFPYLMHYRIEKDLKTVVVFAIYHTSRNPEIWKERK